tara:strand:- start:593 stop:1612 length:1020 start_codon:yes stop_codon:yes gene_type:complete
MGSHTGNVPEDTSGQVSNEVEKQFELLEESDSMQKEKDDFLAGIITQTEPYNKPTDWGNIPDTIKSLIASKVVDDKKPSEVNIFDCEGITAYKVFGNIKGDENIDYNEYNRYCKELRKTMKLISKAVNLPVYHTYNLRNIGHFPNDSNIRKLRDSTLDIPRNMINMVDGVTKGILIEFIDTYFFSSLAKQYLGEGYDKDGYHYMVPMLAKIDGNRNSIIEGNWLQVVYILFNGRYVGYDGSYLTHLNNLEDFEWYDPGMGLLDSNRELVGTSLINFMNQVGILIQYYSYEGWYGDEYKGAGFPVEKVEGIKRTVLLEMINIIEILKVEVESGRLSQHVQ